MGMRSPYSSSGSHHCGCNTAGVVDHMIGNAYTTVRSVAQNIEYIKHISHHMPQVFMVAGGLDNIDAVSAVLDDITSLADNLNAAQLIKNNLTAARAPLPSDDASQGYAVGSRWIWQGQEWVRTDSGWVPVPIAPYASRAAAEAATVPPPINHIGVFASNGDTLWYKRDAAGTALTTVDGVKWSPLPPYRLSHWTEYRGTTGDISAQLQAGIDWIGANSGGELHLGEGIIPIAQTVYWGDTKFPVLIIGLGQGILTNGVAATKATAATRIVWTGVAGGNGLVLTADRNDTGLKPRASSGGIVDVMIDGNNTGGRGLQVISHNEHVIRVHLAWWKDVMFYSDVLQNGVTGAPADTQNFDWDITTSDINATVEAKAHFVAHGKNARISVGGASLPAANTSMGTIRNLSLNVERDTVAAHFGSFDGTVIHNLNAGRRHAGGTGGQVIIHGPATFPSDIAPASEHCRYISITKSQMRQVIAKTGSGPNHIASMSMGNGATTPVIEGTGLIYWSTQDGAATFNSLSGGAVQANATEFQPGKLLRMSANNRGSFGLGGGTSPDAINIDDATMKTGFYRAVGAGSSGTYPSGASAFGMLTVTRYDNNICSQEYRPINVNAAFRRLYASGAWSAWAEI